MSFLNPKVKYKLVKLEQLSGHEASIYSVYIEDAKQTLFERFITENQADYLQEIKEILGKLKSIGHTTSAREQYFRLYEGKPGDGVCALYDETDKLLRLYCIRYGRSLIILGGGGPKEVDTWEEDEKLSEEVKLMMMVSKDIFKRTQEDEIYFTNNGFELEGDLNFNYNDEE